MIAAGLLLGGLVFGAPQRPAPASWRGLSVVSDQVVWVSGTGGSYLRSLDGGRHWTVGHVPAAEKLDFRDVKAFSAATAYLLAVGPAGGIYKTSDGGAHWTRQYHSDDPHFFLDGLAFWDADHGLALGDPLGGKFLLLRTDDGGRHWRPAQEEPPALAQEGAFAASGTCLAIAGRERAAFATGGAAHARVFSTADGGRTWTAVATPLGGGGAGSGIFSLAFRDPRHGIAVGGDYTRPAERASTVALSDDGGLTWRVPAGPPPGGYRSAVAWSHGLLAAAGSNGADVSTDAGRSWRATSALDLNAIAFAPSGRVGFAVGPHGLVVAFRVASHS